MDNKQQQRRSFLFILAGLAVLGVLAGLAMAGDPSSVGLQAYDVTLTPNYISPNDSPSSNYQAVWLYGASPTTPYRSPDSYHRQGRYLLLDPRATDADGRPGQDDWWFVVQRNWPSSYQPSNHGSWGGEMNFHNVAGDAGPGAGIGWGFGSGVSSLSLSWLPGAASPAFTVEPNSPNNVLALPPVTRDTWHTYVVHFVAGRTDGSTVHPGSLTVWADGNNTPAIAVSNINTLQRAQGPDGNWYVQRWMQLWEGDYTQNLQRVSTLRLVQTRIGGTLQEALADRPTLADTSLAGQYYSGSGANDGPPTVTPAGTLTAGDGAIPTSLGGGGQAPVTAAATTAPATTSATTSATTTHRTTTATTTTAATTTNKAPPKTSTTTSTKTTTTSKTSTTTPKTTPTTTTTPAATPVTPGPQSDALARASQPAAVAAAVPVEWDGVIFNGWPELRAHLRVDGISGNAFLRNHPAIATSLALPALTWDGQLFFVRGSFITWLRERGAEYRIWALLHPDAVSQLTP